MTRDEVIAKLRECESALRARGVTHAALFGSTARGDARKDSDIDILVELDADFVRTMYDYAGVKHFIAEMFSAPTDVVDRESLRREVSMATVRDALYAF